MRMTTTLVYSLLLFCTSASAAEKFRRLEPITIPTIDISDETQRHVIIAQGTSDVYQGHPTTLLMPDGQTMFCVWTYGHGGRCGPMKRSADGGRTWSELLPVPKSWQDVTNCPAIYRLVDRSGKARLFVFAQKNVDGEVFGQMMQSHSEDDGRTWSEMVPNGVHRVVMPWCAIVRLSDGRYLAQTNARRPGDPDLRSNNIVQSTSEDGGLTWSPQRVVLDLPGLKPCEPALIRSPDGRQLLSLMRENAKRLNSLVMLSNDEGETWSKPREVASALSGDRHMPIRLPDGRLVIVFRDTAAESPSADHFVAWVGTYHDVIEGREGQYRVKLLHSHKGRDCGYPGLELLSDGTIVATTYVKYLPGPEQNSVVSVRFRIDEMDRRGQQ